MNIIIDDLTSQTIADFLQQHIDDMRATSPPESKHALDLSGLRQPHITFWSAWLDAELVGCIALQRLDASNGEIKSMRVAATARGQGIARQLLEHLEHHARSSEITRLWLETGSMDFFLPARSLYRSAGYRDCGPFAGYWDDPNSVFMQKSL